MNYTIKKDVHSRNNKLILLVLLALVSVLTVAKVHASKTGMDICSNCHTMHNSQTIFMTLPMREGAAGITGYGAGECLDCHAANRAVLLINDCIGCHAMDTGGSAYKDSITNAPQIAYSGTGLAAGNFTNVFEGNDRTGHNVHGFGVTINAGDLGNSPPGYLSAFDPSSIGYDPYSTVSNIMCAGSNGCHGDRSKLSHIDSIKGAHHSADAMLKAATLDVAKQGTDDTVNYTYNKVGSSYRMLLGVKGVEDPEWEGSSPSKSVHNQYKGSAYSSRSGQSQSDIDTMSEFCAECHGDFHQSGSAGIGGGGSGVSPWLRHPVDVLLPTSGEYASYNSDTSYSLTAPVAWQTLSGTVPQNVTSDSVVMCLSCHRAHASPYDKIMRWDYKSTTLGTAISGCSICHTSMN